MKIKLDDLEKLIEGEANNFTPVSLIKKKEIQSIIDSNKAKKSITLRLSINDLNIIKLKANIDGLPYQALIASIIHKYNYNKFIEKEEILKMVHLTK